MHEKKLRYERSENSPLSPGFSFMKVKASPAE